MYRSYFEVLCAVYVRAGMQLRSLIPATWFSVQFHYMALWSIIFYSNPKANQKVFWENLVDKNWNDPYVCACLFESLFVNTVTHNKSCWVIITSTDTLFTDSTCLKTGKIRDPLFEKMVLGCKINTSVIYSFCVWRWLCM